MSDSYPPAVQRPALLDLVRALGCRDNALRRDDCSDWRISGKRGCIYTVPEGFQIVVLADSGRWWGAARRAIEPFARLTNDGEDEGALILDRLPSPEEAETIRHYLAVGKKRELDEATLARLRERLAGEGFRAKKPASNGFEGAEAPDRQPGGD